MKFPNPPEGRSFVPVALTTLNDEEKQAVGDRKVIGTPQLLFIDDGTILDRKTLEPLGAPAPAEPVKEVPAATSGTPDIEWSDMKAKDLIDYIKECNDPGTLDSIAVSETRKSVLSALDKQRDAIS